MTDSILRQQAAGWVGADTTLAADAELDSGEKLVFGVTPLGLTARAKYPRKRKTQDTERERDQQPEGTDQQPEG